MKYLAVLFLACLATMVVAGRKDRCADACPLNYDPICASTCECKCKNFGNQCALDVYKCNNPNKVFDFVKHGECPRKCTVEKLTKKAKKHKKHY